MSEPISYPPVIVGGYGGSGSSAVIDLLKEYRGFYSIVPELRIITDPDGLLSLDNVIKNGWSPYQSDIAIKRFACLIDKVSRKGGAPYHNQNFNKTICPAFESISKEYIARITKMTYKGMWVGINNRRSVFYRKLAKVFGKTSEYAKTIALSCDYDEFLAETRSYLERLLDSAAAQQRAIIDEGYSSLLGDRVLSLFENAKLIVVRRDPRDTYANAIKYSYVFVPRSIDGYIAWYKSMMEHANRHCRSDSILNIRFEELVRNYDACVKAIEAFIEVETGDHVAPKRFLDPQISGKNVGQWKYFADKESIFRIENELADYCIDL